MVYKLAKAKITFIQNYIYHKVKSNTKEYIKNSPCTVTASIQISILQETDERFKLDDRDVESWQMPSGQIA